MRTMIGRNSPADAGREGEGYHFNLTYLDQLADHTVGVAIGFAHTSTPFEGEQFSSLGLSDRRGRELPSAARSHTSAPATSIAMP